MIEQQLSQILLWLVPLFFITALFYSSVGFGGGSTYVALLALIGMPMNVLPSTALTCNIIVVLGGCYFFWKEKNISPKLVLPFLIASIPFAYLGARLPISKQLFLFLLGMSLFVASLRLFLKFDQREEERKLSVKQVLLAGVPIGAGLGFLSGLTGIGGGIFLAPVLYFLRWGNAKKIAAAASVFILANSVSGLAGQVIKNSFVMQWDVILPLGLSVFLGGQIGSRLVNQKYNLSWVQKMTATLILVASVRILWNWYGGL